MDWVVKVTNVDGPYENTDDSDDLKQEKEWGIPSRTYSSPPPLRDNL